MVSVVMITYGHEAFIEDAINGVLMQEVNFPVELIIADDCSPDYTNEKVALFSNHTNAHWIRYTRHESNIGMMPNFTWALRQARGKYIALCEGDDYWTDPLKLQKQVEFLEANEEYSGCFHKAYADINGELKEDVVIEKRYSHIADKEKIIIDDLFNLNNFTHTCSVMFRNNLITIPFEVEYSAVGDYFLLILLAEKGYLYRMENYMAVYRSGVGIHSTLAPVEMLRKKVQTHIAILSYLSDHRQKSIFLPKTLKVFEDYAYMVEKQSDKKLNYFLSDYLKRVINIIKELFSSLKKN